MREIQDGRLSRNVRIRDGDTIFVPKAERFFVVGMIRNAGSYILERDMTVLQAIMVGRSDFCARASASAIAL